jgi:hypothetical protein
MEYLGFICGRKSLPARLKPLREEFKKLGFPEATYVPTCGDWSNSGVLEWRKGGRSYMILEFVLRKNVIRATLYIHNPFNEGTGILFPVIRLRDIESDRARLHQLMWALIPSSKENTLLCEIFAKTIILYYQGLCKEVGHPGWHIPIWKTVYQDRLRGLPEILDQLGFLAKPYKRGVLMTWPDCSEDSSAKVR